MAGIPSGLDRVGFSRCQHSPAVGKLPTERIRNLSLTRARLTANRTIRDRSGFRITPPRSAVFESQELLAPHCSVAPSMGFWTTQPSEVGNSSISTLAKRNGRPTLRASWRIAAVTAAPCRQGLSLPPVKEATGVHSAESKFDTIGTVVTSRCEPQTNRQSLRFASTTHSPQSENISGVTQERI